MMLTCLKHKLGAVKAYFTLFTFLCCYYLIYCPTKILSCCFCIQPKKYVKLTLFALIT